MTHPLTEAYFAQLYTELGRPPSQVEWITHFTRHGAKVTLRRDGTAQIEWPETVKEPTK